MLAAKIDVIAMFLNFCDSFLLCHGKYPDSALHSLMSALSAREVNVKERRRIVIVMVMSLL